MLGKFIVIDGTDGSGKETQSKILIRRLKRKGYKVALIHFPQYGKKSAGAVEEYLNGKYGTAREVGPYRASIFYAIDRYDGSFKIREWLKQGKVVIADRYVASNMGHQGGKIKNSKKRKEYLNWLYNLEFNIFKIPKPDLNIILHVEAEIAQKLANRRKSHKSISSRKRDIHEADLEHLKNAERVYLEIAQSYPGFTLIECTRDGQIMNIEDIHQMIWKKVIKILK